MHMHNDIHTISYTRKPKIISICYRSPTTKSCAISDTKASYQAGKILIRLNYPLIKIRMNTNFDYF